MLCVLREFFCTTLYSHSVPRFLITQFKLICTFRIGDKKNLAYDVAEKRMKGTAPSIISGSVFKNR